MNPQDPYYPQQPQQPPGYPQQQPGYNPSGGYPQQPDYPQQPGYTPPGQPQPNYPEQPGYAPQPEYPEQPGYAPQPGYGQPQPGYPPPAQPAYPQPSAPQQAGYPPQQPGYAPPPGYPPQQPGYAPQPGYPPPGGAYTGGYGQPPQPPRPGNRGALWAIIGGVVVVALIVVVVVVALSKTGGGTPTAHTATPTATTAAPTATTAAATATPAARILYQDSMTDNPSGWPNNSICSEQGDGYHIITGSTGEICYSPVADTTGDASLGASVQTVTTNGASSYGLVFRGTTTGNFYAFEITPDGRWIFYKSVNGSLTTIHNFTADSSINTGTNASNDLQVVAIGSSFSFFVNNTQVGQATDSTFATGSWGIDDNSSNAEVIYTNVLILAA